ncbi:YciE/YciF ferroxidase family protein [Mucilaginibacter phyllosphaerae]
MPKHTQPTPDDAFLKQIFLHHLTRIYNAKRFLQHRTPHLIKMASFEALAHGVEEFGGDVNNQIKRMEEIYKLIGETPSPDVCNPIKSIVKDEFCLDEGQDVPLLNDLDLMLYLQVLEHINITSYRMLIMIAKMLKYDEVKQLLTENFDESADNDQLFTLIAKEYITAD